MYVKKTHTTKLNGDTKDEDLVRCVGNPLLMKSKP